ncbi:MAG TPA: indole-3-glycerol phosphate synthase TrpC [Lachnospiraceae bacterium]|nr:indole-3-glycerol phosphate synthase TrpC [Lachnospiraceae bacterium]
MILEKIAARTRQRVFELKLEKCLDVIKGEALKMNCITDFPFEKALRSKDISFICEVKKASPSKGIIAPNFPYLDIAIDYEKSGAAAISVLTEPYFFMGSDRYLKEIASTVSVPVLRKDFTIDEYQIYEAKTLGASAILLICALLDTETLKTYLDITHSLGMSAIVEAHTAEEVESAVAAGARIIGVNNRNLKTFEVNLSHSFELRRLVPDDIIFISESGIKTPDDVRALRNFKTDAVLIGETLMRCPNKKDMLEKLKGRVYTKIKICGIYRPQDIEFVNEAKPDYIGFVFYEKSHRNVTPAQAKNLKSMLSSEIEAVGVFVDEDKNFIAKLANDGIIDLIQLHGNEDSSYIAELKALTNKLIIKAIKIETDEDAEKIKNAFKLGADYIMLDSGKGSGKAFDWSMVGETENPIFLAGGLNSQNIVEAIETFKPFAVDVSSSVETNKVKDKQKILEIVDLVRRTQYV